MHVVALVSATFLGTFVWVLNPDAAAALFAVKHRWVPPLVGLVAAGGQSLAHLVLYAGGDLLRRRWAWFDQRCERARQQLQARLGAGILSVAGTSGLFGLPPSSITATLAPALGLAAGRVLPLLFLARAIRFTVVATLATQIGRVVSSP